jgi:type I restriction enzyme M protein
MEPEMIPTWLEKRHKILWETFAAAAFRFDDAAKVLKDKMHDSENQINVFLSELRKRGWIEVETDKDDARKKIYRIISKEEIISETLAITKNQLTRADLDGLLKAAADLIRTRVDYTFILLLLFYKRISDKWEADFEKACKDALADGLSESEARQEAKNSIYHDFDISEDLLWENIRKDPARLPENFSRAMKALSELNPELKDVFENVDFVQFASNRENAEILRQLVELFSAKSLHHVAPDILGDAYEWILKYFAPQKAKEGEIYTPREVIKLLVEILDPRPGNSVYDPAYGSGGMLITSYQHVENEFGREALDKLFLFGQEVNYKTLALSKMNIYIHDIRNAQVAQGDSLLYPKFKDKEGIKKFNIVIANPPWNQDGYDEETLKKGEFWKERFNYGFTPRQSADWAWIQHMLASADDKEGRVAVVIDNGCLFRGGKEKAIRTAVLGADMIEAVILLPEKLFYNTGAPGAILILNKGKAADRKGKILFINASREFQRHPEVRKLNQLADSHIGKIVKAHRESKEIVGFSRIVGQDEIKENDFNLNVTLYVFPEKETETIDVLKEWEDLRLLEKESAEIEAKIEGYLKEIYKEK